MFGSVAIDNRATIETCMNSISMNNSNYTLVGGIVANNYGKIESCINKGNLTGKNVGGIACYTTSCNISYVYNVGNLTKTGNTSNNYAGGARKQRKPTVRKDFE